MKAKRIFLVVLVLLIVGGGVWWKRSRPTQGPDYYAGYGEGELIYVASPLGGQLQELKVERGSEVDKGQPLFLLERVQEKAARSEADEAVRESVARLDKAKLDFERAKSLRDKRVIAPENYDAAEQGLQGAQHAMAGRQQALEQADWRYNQKAQAAPIAGLVYDIYYRPGEWVAAGTPVLSVLPPEYRKVRFFVPESDLGLMQIGTPLEVHLDGLEEALPAKVSFVSPSAEYTLPIIYSRENRHKLVYLVEGSLPAEAARKLHPGAPVEVRLKHE